MCGSVGVLILILVSILYWSPFIKYCAKGKSRGNELGLTLGKTQGNEETLY